jgi:hypothetical protein
VDLAEQPLGPPKHGHRTPRGNAAGFDLRAHLYRIAGVDFTRIDGFDALTVQTILAEVGLDPSRFPSEKHFASWLALCPDNRVTGGVVKHTKSRKVVSRVATALRRAAQSAANSRSALGGFYRRLRARLGPAKANRHRAQARAHLLPDVEVPRALPTSQPRPLRNQVPRAHPRVASQTRRLPRIRTRALTCSEWGCFLGVALRADIFECLWADISSAYHTLAARP